MNDLLPNLIEALREELTQYGEMLALLDQQQNRVMERHTRDVLQSVADLNAQTAVIATTRGEREQRQRDLARKNMLGAKPRGRLKHPPQAHRQEAGAAE